MGDRAPDVALGLSSVGAVHKLDRRADHAVASQADLARAGRLDRAEAFAACLDLRGPRLPDDFCLAASTLEGEQPAVFLYLRSPNPLECVGKASRARMALGNNHSRVKLHLHPTANFLCFSTSTHSNAKLPPQFKVRDVRSLQEVETGCCAPFDVGPSFESS